MIRILQFFCEPLANGGQESFVMNMYRNIDHNKIQFDFFTPFYITNKELEKEIRQMGGNVYVGNGKFDSKANKKDFKKISKIFLKEHNYQIVHIHSGSIFSLAFGAKIAKKSGAKSVIVHSHATGINNFKYKIIKTLSSSIFLKYADEFFACSIEAAKWKFPNSIIKKEKYRIIKNGIDIEKFKFNGKIRNEYREKLGFNNKFVICHIGRFDLYKNQRFLVEIFKDIHKDYKNAVLVFVGDGDEKTKIESIVNNYQISDNVIFLGIRNDINKILQAVDLVAFPSIFEGLGMVTIEAQTAGLKTLVSESIPNEANISELFERIPLSSKNEWTNRIENYIKINDDNRKDMSNIIREKGYDSKEVAAKLEYLYMNL